jgi:antitoxin component of MazEF toxin-antitoxin module
MVKTISKVGNSHGIVLDVALMDLAHLKAGDEANVEVHEGGHDHAEAPAATPVTCGCLQLLVTNSSE